MYHIYIYMRDICAACGFPLIMIFWVCEMCKSNQITVPCIIQTPSNNTMYNACSATQHHVLNQELVSNTTAHSTYVQSAWRKAPYLIETVSFPLMAGRPVLWALNAPLSPENPEESRCHSVFKIDHNELAEAVCHHFSKTTSRACPGTCIWKVLNHSNIARLLRLAYLQKHLPEQQPSCLCKGTAKRHYIYSRMFH